MGAFQIECNSFVSERSTIGDFARQSLVTGDAVGPQSLGADSELAGAWQVLTAAGADVVPSVVAASSPGPPLTRAALSEIVSLARAPVTDAIDGAFFALHGSALADGEDDPEGVLLQEIRSRLAPGALIAISLDHHAHMTERMLASVDIVTAYRTCPHVDLFQRGAQAARILVEGLAGRVRPVCAMAKRPMITPADRHDSATEPLAGLMARCEAAENAGALAAALLTVQPWLDVPELGWAAVVTTDGDPQMAADVAQEIVGAAWAAREGFLGGVRPAVADALRRALEGPAPYVLADAGDATNGGSPGDSTELLRAALADGRGKVLLSVRDAEAARRIARCATGERLTLDLGSGRAGAYNARLTCQATVLGHGGGQLRYTHPAAPGADDAGRCGVVAIGHVHAVVHVNPVRIIDPSLYLAVGLDPKAYDVVQAKSQVSYRAGFAGVSPRSVVADTPGPTAANLALLPYRRRPRPMFPFERI